jgi:hypothetical protein
MVSPSSSTEIAGLKKDERNGSSRILDNKDNTMKSISAK